MIEIEETDFHKLYHLKIRTTLGTVEFPATINDIVDIWKDLGNFILTQFLKQYKTSFLISTRWTKDKLELTINRDSKKRKLELHLDEITPLAAILTIISEGIQG